MTQIWYANTALDGDPNNLLNWFTDSSKLTPYGQVPQTGDEVFLTVADYPTVNFNSYTLDGFDSTGLNSGINLPAALTANLLVDNNFLALGTSGDITSTHHWGGTAGTSSTGLSTITFQGAASVPTVSMYVNTVGVVLFKDYSDCNGNIYFLNGFGGSMTFQDQATLSGNILPFSGTGASQTLLFTSNGVTFGGNIDYSGGTISLTSSFNMQAGNISNFAGMTIATSSTMSGGTITVPAGVGLTFNSGTTWTGGTINIHGTLSFPTTITLASGMVLSNWNSTSTINLTGGDYIDNTGGTFNAEDGAYSLPSGSALSGGGIINIIAGAVLHLSSAFSWTGLIHVFGTLDLTNNLTLSSGVELTQEGSTSSVVWSGQLVINGITQFLVTNGALFTFLSANSDTIIDGTLTVSYGAKAKFEAGCIASTTCTLQNLIAHPGKIEFENASDIQGNTTLIGNFILDDSSLMGAGVQIGTGGASFIGTSGSTSTLGGMAV